MRIILTLISVVLFSSAVVSQQRVMGPDTHRQMSSMSNSNDMSSRTPNDTLWWIAGSSAHYPYLSDGSGYVCGRNNYGDKAHAQQFLNTIGNIGVLGAIVWVGVKDGSGGANSKIQIKEYSMDGVGKTTIDTLASAPGTVNASVDALFTDIDTGTSFASAAHTYLFSSPVITPLDFAIGVDYDMLAAGDTLGLVSSSDADGPAGAGGDAHGHELAWLKSKTNKWYSLLLGWQSNIDLAIWAIVDENPSGINENVGFVNGINLSQNQPNPAIAGNSTSIDYELAQSANVVTFMVFDVAGKLVYSSNEGGKAAGKHTIQLNSNLPEGTYYYALTADKNRLAHKMIVGR